MFPLLYDDDEEEEEDGNNDYDDDDDYHCDEGVSDDGEDSCIPDICHFSLHICNLWLNFSPHKSA